MPINGGLPNSSSTSSSSSTHRTFNESMGRLKILKYDCKFSTRKRDCPFGDRCRFNHRKDSEKEEGVLYLGGPERFGEPDCEFYLLTGTCGFGPACKYHHPRDRYGAGPVLFNSLDLPIRQGEMSCTFYLKNGHCKYGATCRYNHPEPVADRTSSYNSHTSRGPTGSSAAPLTGRHSTGSVTSSLSPAASHNSDQHSQSPETYMPLVISPSQGLGLAYGWNSYLGYTSPISYASIHGTAVNPVMYNPYTGASSYSSSVIMLPTSYSCLPERPDQPECRDFMHTGICKYGSDCKYHHPREKKAQMDALLLSPPVLPIRSDQAICSPYYSLYDHPLLGTLGGYSYNNGLSYASVSGIGQPFLYQNSLPSFHILEMLPKPAKVSVTVSKPDGVTWERQNLDTCIREAPREHSLVTVEPATDHSAR